MREALVIALILIGGLSLPIVGRLWRAGRISHRTTAIIVLGLAPLLVFAFGVIQGYDLAFNLGVTGLLVLVAIVFYRRTVELFRDQRAGERR